MERTPWCQCTNYNQGECPHSNDNEGDCPGEWDVLKNVRIPMTMRVSVRIPMTMRESVRVREVCCGPDTWHWYCPASDTPTSRTISTNSSPRVTSTLYLSNDDIKKNQITCTEAGILINNYLFIAGILSTAYAGLGICTLFCFFCSFERATRANCSGRSFKKSEKSESLWFKSEKLKLKLKQILITLFLFAF